MGLFDFLKPKKEPVKIISTKKLNPKAKYHIVVGNEDFPATEKDLEKCARELRELKFMKKGQTIVTSHLIEFKELKSVKK